MLIAIGFVATVLAVATALVTIVAIAAHRARLGPRVVVAVAAGLAGWLALTGIAGAGGALALTDGPPRVLGLAWIALLGAVLALRHPTARALIAATPRAAVIALQVFRVPVELVLWRLFVAGRLPVELTFEGRNLDVLVGITAIPIAISAWGNGRRRSRLALTWHVGGLLLLLNIVAMAVLSAPGPQHVLDLIPTNTVIGELPFVWLPAFLVPVAAIGHLVGIRQAIAAGAITARQ